MTKLRIMNAAGTARTIDDVHRLCRSEALTDITIGAFTVPVQAGHGGRDFAHIVIGTNSFFINSRGMPNGGVGFLKNYLRTIWNIVKASGKRLRVNVSAYTIEQVGVLVGAIIEVSREIIIELNLGCPNIWQDGEQHEMWSFDPSFVRAAAEAAWEAAGSSNALIALKLSPYSQPSLLNRIADTILSVNRNDRVVSEIVYANTWPNSFLWDFNLDAPAIEPAGGLGGGSGAGILPIVLGGIRQFKQKMGASGALIIGAGGIENGHALAQHVKAGADGIQIGGALYGTLTPAKTVFEIQTEFAQHYPQLATTVT